MEDIKIRIKDEEISKEVQELLFSKGIYWSCGDKPIVRNTNDPYLYVSDNNIYWGNSSRFFNKTKAIRIKAKNLAKYLEDQGI